MPASSLPALLLVPGLLSAQVPDLRTGRLDNGMTLVLLPRPGADTVVAAWASDRGTASDPPGRSGRAAALAAALDPEAKPVSVGADGLHHQTALPAESLRAWLSAQARALRPAGGQLQPQAPEAPPEPLERLRAFAGELALQPHPYGRPATGWPAERAALRPADLQAAVTETLAPDHLLLVVAADLPWETFQAWAQEAFGAWTPAAPEAAPVPQSPSPLGDRRGILPTDGSPALLTGWPAPPASHPDHPALQVLAEVLAGGRSAPLARRLTGFNGPAARVEALPGWPGARGPNLFVLGGVARDRDTLPAELGSGFQAEVQRLRQAALPEDALVRVRARDRAREAAWALDPDAAVAAVVEGWQQTGRPTGARDLLRARSAVTPADLLRVARATLGDQDRVTVVLTAPRAAQVEANAQDQELGRLLERVIAAELPKDPIKVKEMVLTQLQLMQSLRPEEKARVLEDLRRKVKDLDGRKP